MQPGSRQHSVLVSMHVTQFPQKLAHDRSGDDNAVSHVVWLLVITGI